MASRSKAAVSPVLSFVSTVSVAGPQVRWKSTSVPSLSNRIARIGINEVLKVPTPHDPSFRADATALIRRHIHRRGAQLAVAALAAACQLGGVAHAKDPVPLPPLRPSIAAHSPII